MAMPREVASQAEDAEPLRSVIKKKGGYANAEMVHALC